MKCVYTYIYIYIHKNIMRIKNLMADRPPFYYFSDDAVQEMLTETHEMMCGWMLYIKGCTEVE